MRTLAHFRPCSSKTEPEALNSRENKLKCRFNLSMNLREIKVSCFLLQLTPLYSDTLVQTN